MRKGILLLSFGLTEARHSASIFPNTCRRAREPVPSPGNIITFVANESNLMSLAVVMASKIAIKYSRRRRTRNSYYKMTSSSQRFINYRSY